MTDKVIRYGLGPSKAPVSRPSRRWWLRAKGAVKGLRAPTKGPFSSLFDFCVRVDKARLNKRTGEALIKAGAFDSMNMNRRRSWRRLTGLSFAAANAANVNQGGLFDMMGDDAHGSSSQSRPGGGIPWGIKERLTLENRHWFLPVRPPV